ncbi:MAG TPA: hypothetical protein VJ546_09600 [Bacillales bacterium]|nr:hypothetical protein [Bacillales bacterium]
MKISRFIRKIHRALAIPMLLLVITKIISTGTAIEGTIQKMTEVTMMIMLLSGVFLYFLTMKRKKYNKH